MAVKRRRAPAKIRRSATPVIDVHTHIRTPMVSEFVRTHPVSGGPGKQPWPAKSSAAFQNRQAGAVRARHTDPKARLRDMDRMGVDIQVISENLPQSCYWADGAEAAEMARACNDAFAEFVAFRPDRFVAIGVVPLQDVPRAVRELERAVTRLGLKGAVVSTNIRNRDLGEPRFHRFWAKAEALGVPIFLHPQGFTHPDRMQKFFLSNSIAQPLEETLAMASLIHEGVMDRFPKLKLCIPHGGGFLPFYSGRVDRAFEIRPEASENISKPPSAYMRRFLYDTVIFDRAMLTYLVNKVGAGRVMMGTDYPVLLGEQDPVGFIRGTRALSREAKEKILYRNAARLLKIPL